FQGGSSLKRKQKIALTICAIAVAIIAILATWYFSPRTFLNGVEPSDVSYIDVFDGSTGKSFTIEDSEEIKYIVENIQGIEMKRANLSVNYSGFSFRMDFRGSNGEVIDSFIMNGAQTICDHPFFYRCDGGLCFDYLTELEEKYMD
ncbi:MAG: hypothetical protein ACI4CC_05055, partial [Lachnospiraceae bacterium]